MPGRVVGPLARVGLRLEEPGGTLHRSRDTTGFVPLYWQWTCGQVPSTPSYLALTVCTAGSPACPQLNGNQVLPIVDNLETNV